MNVLFSFDIKEKYLDSLKSEFNNIQVKKAVNIKQMEEKIGWADILVGMLMRDFDSDLISQAVNLKWIQSWSAGVDVFLKEESFRHLNKNEIILTSVSGIHKDSMSEQVMGYLISFSRRLPEFLKLQKKRKWERLKVDYLKDKNLAVFGLGAVGREIARKAKVFKMRVTGTKRNTDLKIPNVDELYNSEQKEVALRNSDFIVVTLPLTEDTCGYFGYEEFKEMSKSCYFINVSRGKIVKENELIKALQEEEIAGAALDVFENEPLAEDSPLYEMDNVIITPHISGLFPDYNREAIKIFKKNLRRFSDNQKMVNVIDPDLQY